MSAFDQPCWHCGGKPVYIACNYFEGHQTVRPCCYNYPRCRPSFTKSSRTACDICNRDVETYMILYPDHQQGNKFCARCISETISLRNTSGITIVDKDDWIIPS